MSTVVGVTFLHLTLLTKGYSYAKVQDIPGLLLLVNMFIIYYITFTFTSFLA